MEFKGFVGKINEKSGQGSRGPWTLYSTKIAKPDGTEYPQWITFGFDAPTVKEGDYVKIETEKDDRNNEKVVSVKKLKNPPERKAVEKKSSGGFRGNGGGNKFDGSGIQNRSNPADVERMSYANARDHAIKVVELLLAQNALPLSKTATKAGEAKRFSEITAMIDKLTVQFQKDGVSLRLLETVADGRAVAEDKAAKKVEPLPDDSDEDEEEETEEDESEEEESEEEEEAEDDE